jgi:hypothetical protein
MNVRTCPRGGGRPPGIPPSGGFRWRLGLVGERGEESAGLKIINMALIKAKKQEKII